MFFAMQIKYQGSKLLMAMWANWGKICGSICHKYSKYICETTLTTIIWQSLTQKLARYATSFALPLLILIGEI